MATVQQIRDLIAQTTTGTARPRVPREVRDEVCRYVGRRRREGAAWAVIARGLVFSSRDEESPRNTRCVRNSGARLHDPQSR